LKIFRDFSEILFILPFLRGPLTMFRGTLVGKQ